MIGWGSFAIALLAFAAAALPGSAAARGVDSFFHIPGERRNAISLGIADITLGTGFAYILTATAQFGLALLAMPVGLLAGYLLLGWVYRHSGASASDRSSNLLLHLRQAAMKAGAIKSRWSVDALLIGPLILVYLVAVAYEIFASSQIIGAFIAPDQGVRAAALIGAGLILVSGVNSVAGGMQANWRNDTLLATGILTLFAIVIVAALAAPAPERSAQALVLGPGPIAAAGVVAAVAFLNAVATQPISLLNVYNASNLPRAAAASAMFRRVGLLIALLLALLVLVGALRPLDMSQGLPAALGARLAAFDLPVWASVALRAVVVFGMAAVVFSTVDTLMIALAFFIRRHLLDRPTEGPQAAAEPLRPTRLLVAALFFLTLPPLAVLYLADPNLFSLLLAIAGGAAVFAPLIVAGALAAARPDRIARLTTPVLALFFALFAGAAVTGAVLLGRAPQLIPLTGLGFLLASIVLSLGWYTFAGQNRARLA